MKNNICIIGMGYVGLTLAGVCLKSGHNVTGVELQDEIKQTINNGKAHFYEPGLNEILESAVLSKKLHCIHPNEHKKISNCEIFIITVGTPLIPGTENPNLKYIKSALDTIIPYLDENKLIILRSTIVVGLTRSEVIPHIIKNSNLLESQINISFAPERTVEGNALSELTDLPQVIGYNNPVAKQLVVNFFQSYVNDIKLVDSIEAAELVKLFNNVYRDLNFSIGNAFNDISKYYNLDGYKIIEAANYNYDRSRIALPGFVGGPCLEKDPHSFNHSAKKYGIDLEITKAARFVNENHPKELVSKIVDRSCKSKSIDKLKIVFLGMAFKGKPLTDDLRGSMATFVLKEFKRIEKYFGRKGKVGNTYQARIIDIDMTTVKTPSTKVFCLFNFVRYN